MNDAKKPKEGRVRWGTRTVLIAASVALLLPMGGERGQAQSDPTTIGAGQKPFVLILLDTSASMEYSLEGEERYPKRNYPSTLFGNPLDEWQAGESITLTNNADDFPSQPRSYIGPCKVWAPQCTNSGYDRPVWYPPAANALMRPNSRGVYNNGLSEMRGVATTNPTLSFVTQPSQRLRDENQSRHVQIKEILTGDMILRPRDVFGNVIQTADAELNPQLHGPGCFFVPRMVGAGVGRSADSYRVCHTEAADGRLTSQTTNFSNLIDHTEVRPHFQEVFDFQLRTGLMDNLSNTVVFGVALFDGYRGDMNGSGSVSNQLNDTLSSESHAGTSPPESTNTYNLGVHKFITPKTFDVSSSQLPGIATFSQFSVVDSGYVHTEFSSDHGILPDTTASNEFGVTIPTGLGNIVTPYYGGQQPLGGATPLAAAVHDIHNFFVHGTYERQDDGSPYTAANRRYSPVGGKFFNTDTQHGDPYYECRGKHVVIMTDGFPQPESNVGGVNDLGLDQLSAAFGYEDLPNSYPYESTEAEVSNLMASTNSSISDPRFQTHVHVVALNTDSSSNNDAKLRKMGEIAREGNTCALFYLSKSAAGRAFIPFPTGSDWAGLGGTCDPATGNCLVRQLPNGTYLYPQVINPNMPETPIDCIAPALILQHNDRSSTAPPADLNVRDELTQALQLVFNEALSSSGGVASRTRTSTTNSLDASNGTERRLGQYRLFSGVEISGGLYWKGLINREPKLCPDPNAPLTCADPDNPTEPLHCVWPLHDEISAQVVDGGVSGYTDNRRIFTSHPILGDVNDPNAGLSVPSNFGDVITMKPQLRASTNDVFSEPEFTTMEDAARTQGTRVPWRLGALVEVAFDGAFSENTLSPAQWTSALGASNSSDARDMVDTVRGRHPEKQGRVLNAILNANPVTVGPPDLDLPIESYRDFRERFSNRATMIYAATLDGLLHAIHTGEHNAAQMHIMRRERSALKGSESPSPVRVGSESQREAWAYAPHMLRRSYAANKNRQPNLMDGSPVVSDVRLCHQNPIYNQNDQACNVVSTGSDLPGVEQWRTVLVQGLGQAGSGYFALDVTRTGGPIGSANAIVDPDPVSLWEFDPNWEFRQIQQLKSQGQHARYSGSNAPASIASCTPISGVSSLDDLPYMGLSVGDPAIGTVVLQMDSADDETRVQRPITMFTAGQSANDIPGSFDCEPQQRLGRALYIVDLQTGSMLRRFVEYFDRKDGTNKRFEAELLGTPTLYNGRPGSVANRAFFGDVAGRLFRVDMSRPKLNDWTVELMYDPCHDPDLLTQVSANLSGSVDATTCGDFNNPPFGAAVFPPSVALSANRELVITYGLGDRTDTSTAGKAQAVIAIVERLKLDGLDLVIDVDVDNIVRWRMLLDEGEKLTGEPVVFNSGVYFTSYAANIDDFCEPGRGRIYGLSFGETTNKLPHGLFDPADLDLTASDTLSSPDVDTSGNHFWIGPYAPTLMRGLAVTFGAVCSFDPSAALGNRLKEQQDPQPVLIAQTGGSDPNSTFGEGRNTDFTKDNISRFVVKIKPPRTQTVPLSWSVISN